MASGYQKRQSLMRRARNANAAKGSSGLPGSARPRLFSLLGAAGIFVLCSALGYTILNRQLYTNMLLARNEAEQTMNNLFTVIRQEKLQEERPPGEPRYFGNKRELPDFVEIFEEYPRLKEKIAGIGWYSADGEILFRYGEIPDRYPGAEGRTSAVPKEPSGIPPWRNYVFDEESRTLHVITYLPLPHSRKHRTQEPAVLVFSLRQEDYRLKNRMAWGLFAGWEALLLLALWRVRSLLAKNRDYRRRLQEQKELVALGAAARTLAHEIKNPLSAIQLQADIIGRLCPEKVAPELEAITQEVGRLTRLTGRIGDFLREPRGMPTPIELGNFARDIVRKSGVRADFSAGEEVWVITDPDRLHSIIDNLLRNALESGGEPAAVEIKVFRRGGKPGSSSFWAVLEVLDRGAGLPEGSAGRIFDPFFTTKSKGSGVGLAIARRFAEAAGGSLKIENREGGGVRAALEIPGVEEAKK
jgi:two-component system sensor histidine kinase HydH